MMPIVPGVQVHIIFGFVSFVVKRIVAIGKGGGDITDY